jgi:hypothetical protein
MGNMNWLPVLIGFAGGNVASTAINALVAWCYRPIISARLVQDIRLLHRK